VRDGAVGLHVTASTTVSAYLALDLVEDELKLLSDTLLGHLHGKHTLDRAQ
jgi:hypothetical protein